MIEEKSRKYFVQNAYKLWASQVNMKEWKVMKNEKMAKAGNKRELEER